MSIKSKKIAGNMRIKPVHILLAVPVWMAISIAVPLGTTVSLIILATLLICYFLLRILVSLERLRFDMREKLSALYGPRLGRNMSLMRISTEPRPVSYLEDLHDLIGECVDGNVSVGDRAVTISADAARELGLS